MAKLAPLGFYRAFDNDGNPVPGGKVHTYEAGTITPKATYTSVSGTVANTNPVILDANGYADIWLDSGAYKFVLTDENDVELRTSDNIQGDALTAFGSSVVTQSTNLAITDVYQNAIINCSTTLTLTLLPAATAGEGFYFVVKNTGSGAVTIDPDASELIDGAANASVRAGQSALIYCSGTAWFTAFGVPTSIFVDSVQATASSGVVLKNSAGTTVLTAGSAATTNVSIAGALTLGTALAVAQGGTAGTTTAAAFNSLNAAFFNGKILTGLTLSNNGTDPTNDIDIAAGSAVSDDGTTIMTLASSYTKQLDVNWVVGTNQGGLDTGSIANGTYHVFLIHRTDTGVTDVLFSTSATAPTMPANYTKKKRIGSIVRESAAIVTFTQYGNMFTRVARSLDVNLSSLSTTGALVTLKVPVGIVVRARMVIALNGGSTCYIAVTSPNETNTAAGADFSDTVCSATVGQDHNEIVRTTDTSAQVRYRASAASATFFKIWSLGWVDETQ